MKIAPVTHYREPEFPTRAILDAQPELLRRVPRRWQRHALVLTTLATACLLTADRWSWSADAPAKTARIAPIFQHGDGRGSFGCDAVAPPVFLGEDEARQVIIEEGKRAGLDFHADVLTLPDVAVPLTPPEGARERKDPKGPKTQQKPLALDGTDEKRHISFEFISEKDYAAWRDKPENYRGFSSVSHVDYLATAQTLHDGLLQAKPEGAIGIFYEPLPSYSEAAKEQAREELRQQVRDFIVWLKGQGVI